MQEETKFVSLQQTMQANAFKLREAFGNALVKAGVVEYHPAPSDTVLIDQVKGICYVYVNPYSGAWTPFRDQYDSEQYLNGAHIRIIVHYRWKTYFVYLPLVADQRDLVIEFLKRLDEDNIIALHSIRDDGTLGLPAGSTEDFYVYDATSIQIYDYPFRVPRPENDDDPRYINHTTLLLKILEDGRCNRSNQQTRAINH